MITLTITEHDLVKLMTAAAEAGAAKVAAAFRPSEDLICQNEAWRRYGKRIVQGWVERGLVKPRKVGISTNSKLVYSASELHALCRALEVSDIIVRRSRS